VLPELSTTSSIKRTTFVLSRNLSPLRWPKDARVGLQAIG
jgi:hypothetical protein